jgi:hypothetical protein
MRNQITALLRIALKQEIHPIVVHRALSDEAFENYFLANPEEYKQAVIDYMAQYWQMYMQDS